MADPRILTYQVPKKTGVTHFQIGFSDDGENWDTVKVEGTTDLAVGLLASDYTYELDGVNIEDDADNNSQSASIAPQWYRVRVKIGGKWKQWGEPFVHPSPEDFVAAMKRQLKDPSLEGGTALLIDADYRLHLANAVEAFEKYHPAIAEEVFDMEASVTGYRLPYDWTPSFSHITQVEYPVGSSPRRFLPADYVIYDQSVRQWRWRRICPSEAEQARLYFTTRHSRDGSTVPVANFNSVLMWATGDAASQLRASRNQFGDVFTGADFAQIDPRIREWGKIATDFKKQAEAMWGAGVTGVRSNIAHYEDHGRIPGRVLGP
jgi:hypothetical protein